MKSVIQKAWPILLLVIVIVAMAFFVSGCTTGDVAGGAGFAAAILSLAPVQAAIVAVLLILLAAAIQRWTWVRHVINFGILAYEFAEKEGLAQQLKGYQKFDPFMNKFIEAYREKYGQDPDPEAKGIAVKTMEQKVQEEHLPGK